MKRWQWITLGCLAAAVAAVAVGWATRQPFGEPGVYVNLDIPPWLAVAILAAVVVRLGWELYRGQAILDDLDRTSDDADLAARAVARHDDEIAEMREWIAAIATPVVITDAQPTVIVVEEPVTEPKTEPNPAVRPRPMPGPRTTPQAKAVAAGTKAAEGHANGGTRITDPDIARLFADWEQSERDLRQSFEETTT